VLGSPRNPPISNNIFKISHAGVLGDPYTPLGFPTFVDVMALAWRTIAPRSLNKLLYDGIFLRLARF
jgi:hypothetical protein